MRWFALILALMIGADAYAQNAVENIEPRDCKFFDALGAGSDRNSTDTAAFGKAFSFQRMSRVSFHVSWASLTGTKDGTVKVQVSSVPLPGASDWVDKSGANFTVDSTDGQQLISLANLTERWARIVYTHNSISGGTITGYCHAKGV